MSIGLLWKTMTWRNEGEKQASDDGVEMECEVKKKFLENGEIFDFAKNSLQIET